MSRLFTPSFPFLVSLTDFTQTDLFRQGLALLSVLVLKAGYAYLSFELR